jgi:hypothetical protein
MKANQKPKLSTDTKAMQFDLLITAGISIVIFFALMNIGTYINGNLSSSLSDTYEDNIASGSISNTITKTGSGNGTTAYSNYSLPTYASLSDLNSNSDISVQNTNSTIPMWFNLSVNGNTIYNKTIAASAYDNTTFTSLISAGNITGSTTYSNVSYLTNRSNNSVVITYSGSYYKPSDYRSDLENSTVNSLENITADYDSTIDVMTVASIIMVITLPLASIIGIRRLI